MTSRYPVLNIWVDDIDLEQALASVVDWVEKGTCVHTIFATNPEKNYSVPKDSVLYEMFQAADLLIADGIGVVFAARILHGLKLHRLTGIQVMEEICKLSSEKGYKIFLYGAEEEVNEAAAENLSKKFKNLKIVGRANGYLSPTEMKGLVERINESGAQILFLALGSPKQELWISQNQLSLQSVRVCQGVGGSLDIWSGKKKRAPYIFRRLGLEWFYRVVTEPKRLKRQKVYPIFVAQVLNNKLRNMLKTSKHNVNL